MAKNSVFNSDGPAVAEFNMTPMIDVTFQLILFFILVGQVASDALAVMILPEPEKSQAHDPEVSGGKDKLRIILNIVSQSKSPDDLGTGADPEGSRVRFYQLGSTKIVVRDDAGNDYTVQAQNQLKTLVEDLLAPLSDDQKDVFAIEIRADKRLRYDQVAPAMFTVSRAGLTNMQITALRDMGE